jgi:4-amino-4-deoxy-L-arabinose transferase-like glycosyltransferase
MPGPAPAPAAGRARWLTLGVFVAWSATSFYRHVDVSDASLYRVIARHLAGDGAWTTLRYLPGAYPRFYEHLPFGLWPFAVTIRLVGEGALPLLSLALSAATVWLVGTAARRAAGEGAGLLAMFTLATTQNFFFHGSLVLLDVPLLLGAGLVLASLCAETLDARAGALVFAGALVGVAAKGPFGLITPLAVIAGRLVATRSLGWAAKALALTVAAVAPVALFLAASPDWRQHYLGEQVLASFTGQRADGSRDRLFAAKNVAAMFWPGLAFIAAAPLRRWLRPAPSPANAVALRVLAAAAVVGLLGLSLPARKVEHHVFVLFPLLSVVAGVTLGHLVDRLLATRPAVPLWGLAAVLAAGLIAGPLGIARFFRSAPCVGSTTFAPTLDPLPAGTEVDLIATDAPWTMLSSLSAGDTSCHSTSPRWRPARAAGRSSRRACGRPTPGSTRSRVVVAGCSPRAADDDAPGATAPSRARPIGGAACGAPTKTRPSCVPAAGREATMRR